MKRMHWMMIALILMLSVGSVLPVSAQGVVNLSIDDLQFDEFPTAKALVTVRNENGVPIVGLGPDKFEIIEDGRSSFPPSAVTVQVNPDAAISIVMVIDISGSMKGKPIEEAMRAANALIDQLSPQDRAAIIAFADKVDIDPAHLEEGKEIGFTTDKNALRNIVNFLDTKIGWDTPLYDAIYKGVKMVSTEPVGKRAVIAMTDGRDERDNAQGVPVKDAGSLSTPDDPINEANRHNIPIFSIGLGGKIDGKYLRRLAERTGGVYQKAPKPEELTPLFENVLAQLKQQYILTYNSGLTQDNNYHSLMVRVQLPQGQAFNETKFRFSPETPPTSPPASTPETSETELVGIAQVSEASPPSKVTSPGQEPTGIKGIIELVRSTIEKRPLLAVVIGVGLLLLLILIVALLVVLLRGRESKEEEFVSEDFGETYAPAPAWTPGPTEPGTPVMGAPVEDRTEVAPSGWPEVGAPPAAAPPFAGVAAGPEIPAAGGTRVIERAPKHLAMLVDKSRPDRKYDLKGTMNIGRARDNQIVLDDPTVSRHHAWIKAEGEDFLIFDVGSGNGTFVNDERVEEPRRLQNGDIVRFGEVEFAFTKVY